MNDVAAQPPRITRRSWALILATGAAIVLIGYLVLTYVMSTIVFSYMTCDGGPPPQPPAFDVVEDNGCWTYKMPWP